MTLAEIKGAGELDIEYGMIRNALRLGNWDQNGIKQYAKVAQELSEKDGVILRCNRILVPSSLRGKVIDIAHESHQGIGRTKALMRPKVWWPQMDGDIEKKIKACLQCQVQAGKPKPHCLSMTTWGEAPWKSLAIDICGPFPCGNSLVVMVDFFSKWPEILVTKDTSAARIVGWMQSVFNVHGFPKMITCDNGPQFIAREFRQYLTEIDVRCRNVIPYWPQANGHVERLNRAILKAVRACAIQGMSLGAAVNIFLLGYRRTPHTSTGFSPADLIFNRTVKGNLPQFSADRLTTMRKSALHNQIKASRTQKLVADATRKSVDRYFKVGDMVLKLQGRQNKLSTAYDPEVYEVVGVKGAAISIQSPSGIVITRSAATLRHFTISQGYVAPADHNKAEGSVSCMEEEERMDTVDIAPVPALETTPSPQVERQQPQQLGIDDQGLLRRSQRDRKFPSRLNDYIVALIDKKNWIRNEYVKKKKRRVNVMSDLEFERHQLVTWN